MKRNPKTGKVEMIKLSNTRIRLIKELYNSDKDRDKLIETTNIPRTTIIDNLNYLKDNNFVENYTIKTKGRGRPRTYWKIILERCLEWGLNLN